MAPHDANIFADELSASIFASEFLDPNGRSSIFLAPLHRNSRNRSNICDAYINTGPSKTATAASLPISASKERRIIVKR